MAVIAMDLGGTKLAGALLTGGGAVRHRRVAPIEHRGGDEVGELIRNTTRALLGLARKERLRVTSIGVCVPGISNARTGRVWAPNIPGWKDYPLRREIRGAAAKEARIGGRGTRRIPVVIDSDRACCILGETWRGSARGCHDAIYLSVGTGIGAGIMADGQVLRGPGGIAGSIGWFALDRPFRSEYEECGCFEYHASGEGLAKVAEEMKWPNLGKEGISAAEIFAAYHRGNPAAKAIIAQAVEFWGMAVANLVSLFNPQKIIFGGGVFGPAVELLDQILEEARKWAQPIAVRQVKLEGSRLGGDAGLYGAAYLALRMAKEIQ